MKRDFSFAFLFLSVLAAALFSFSPFITEAAASTYYVSPSGSDSNGGSQSSPFQTIQHAADIVNPGDTVIVEDGDYTGSTGGNGYVFYISRSGTSSAPITFESQNKWGAVIDGQNNATAFGIQVGNSAGVNISYVNIEGFEIKGCGNYGSSSYGIFIPQGESASHILIKGNKIHDINQQNAAASSDASGILIGGASYVTVDGNVIYNCGRTGSSSYSKDHGIYDDLSNHDVIINNVCYNNVHGWDIQVASSQNLNIIGNTFASNNTNSPGGNIVLWDGRGPLGSITIEDNIFMQQSGMIWQDISGACPAINMDNDLTISNALSSNSQCFLTSSSNLLNTDPLFLNSAGYDFHLTGNSPAIGAGLYWSGRTYDADDVLVSNPPDIGAYQYVGTSLTNTTSSTSLTNTTSSTSLTNTTSSTSLTNTTSSTSLTNTTSSTSVTNTTSSTGTGSIALISPSNGSTTGTTVDFQWQKPANGGGLQYTLMISTDSAFDNTKSITVASAAEGAGAYAGLAGFFLFGIAFSGGLRRRKKLLLLLAVVVLSTAFFLTSCGGGSSSQSGVATAVQGVVSRKVSGLSPNTQYYWKVIATNNTGQQEASQVSSFTTN